MERVQPPCLVDDLLDIGRCFFLDTPLYAPFDGSSRRGSKTRFTRRIYLECRPHAWWVGRRDESALDTKKCDVALCAGLYSANPFAGISAHNYYLKILNNSFRTANFNWQLIGTQGLFHHRAWCCKRTELPRLNRRRTVHRFIGSSSLRKNACITRVRIASKCVHFLFQALSRGNASDQRPSGSALRKLS